MSTGLLLSLALVSLLAAAPADDGPRAVSLTPNPSRRLDLPSARYFPRPSLLRFVEHTALAATRLVRPEPSDVFIIVPMLAGTAVALNTDIATHYAIKQLPNPTLTGSYKLSYFASFFGEGYVDLAVFALLGVLGGRDEQRAAIAGVQALLAVGAVSRVGKVIFRYERPSANPDKQTFFSPSLSADAMPSGHTMSAFATAAVLSKEYPRAAPVFYLLATWCALARIQEDTHWLSDTVVGAALGLLIGWESWKVTKEFELEVQPWAGGNGAGLQVGSRF